MAACTRCLIGCINPAVKVPESGEFGEGLPPKNLPRKENLDVYYAGPLTRKGTIDQLQSVIKTVGKCLRGNNRQVIDSLYTGLQGVFDRIGNELSGDTQTIDRPALQERLQMLGDGLLFAEIDPSIESLRLKRARAAEKFIKVASQGTTGPQDTSAVGAGVLSDRQRQRIELWLAQERAESIQQVLKSALRELERGAP